MEKNTIICVFCGNDGLIAFMAGGKHYLQCAACGGIFLDPDERPSKPDEKKRYELHENPLNDPAFRAYLCGFIDPVLEKIGPVRTIFDYGSGPVPVLSAILSERGYDVRFWDPFFAPDTEPFPLGADLVVCHEVAEHFFEPLRDFGRMADRIAPRGYLAVGTMLLPFGENPERARERFASWWYREDFTHVSFYTARALSACARSASLEDCGPVGDNCVLFRKSSKHPHVVDD